MVSFAFKSANIAAIQEVFTMKIAIYRELV